MLWAKKIHARNLIPKKNSCGSKIALPPSPTPHNFSNGPSLITEIKGTDPTITSVCVMVIQLRDRTVRCRTIPRKGLVRLYEVVTFESFDKTVFTNDHFLAPIRRDRRP